MITATMNKPRTIARGFSRTMIIDALGAEKAN
jgi:hypothetical protein